MGCCCFSTLRGAAFFVASIHIYYGLQHLLKFIIFPAVFTFLHSAGDVPFVAFLPGMGYAVLYFILGCAIFRGIENESIRAIKWNALGFTLLEVVFFVLRVILGIIPTPTVADLPKSDQPFKWDIYKTLHYFMFTIVGGLVYLCILFLYVQKLGAGHDEFAQLFNLPLTVNPPASNPPAAAGNTSGSSATGGARHRGDGPSGHAHPSLVNHTDSPKRTFLPPPPQLINVNNNKPHSHHHHHHSTDETKKIVAPIGGGHPPTSQGAGGGGLGGLAKEPSALGHHSPPGSPLSPYFLLNNQNSCANVVTSSAASVASNKHKHDPVIGGGGLLSSAHDDSLWHQPRVQSVPMVNHRSSPQLDRLGVAVSSVGNGGLGGNGGIGTHSHSAARAYHLGHEHIPPLIPPFPDPEGSVSGRNGSFGPVDFGSPIGSELGMPPYPAPHLHQSLGLGGLGLPGLQPEPHYQKIPLSPDFSYCLR